MHVSFFSTGKLPPKNEDTGLYSDTCFVVCDGSTGKRGGLWEGKTGGEIASNVVATAALQSDLNGVELVNYLSTALREKQMELQGSGHDIDLETTATCARIVGSRLIVTQVADTAFRINESDTYANHAIIDTLMSETRARYIALTQDIEGGREYIMPLLLNESSYRNNDASPAGYGVLDGSPVPDKFVRRYDFDLHDVRTLEIFTDGYFAIPPTASIESYEELHATVQQRDPHKCLDYPSTKSNDDRTVMIVDFTASQTS